MTARSRSATSLGQNSARLQPTKILLTATGTTRVKIAGWDVRDGFESVATLELQSRVVGRRRPCNWIIQTRRRFEGSNSGKRPPHARDAGVRRVLRRRIHVEDDFHLRRPLRDVHCLIDLQSLGSCNSNQRHASGASQDCRPSRFPRARPLRTRFRPCIRI